MENVSKIIENHGDDPLARNGFKCSMIGICTVFIHSLVNEVSLESLHKT